MKTNNPIRKFLASLFLSSSRQRHYKVRLRPSILNKEESLNKIFMVRYRMGNL